eukprot:GILJ01008275.1.p1 GENE.GILJ01008275.1~~GILJ01008275.1.p1  ORF type:complete len:327 (-),score=46.50 GILJ01008275.1:226-1206(-)
MDRKIKHKKKEKLAAKAVAAGETPDLKITSQPHHIKNKIKRSIQFRKFDDTRKSEKKQRQLKRKREREELGDQAPPKQIPRTLENTREADETVVDPEDVEVAADEAIDEFAPHFSHERAPKIMLTTCQNPSGTLFEYVRELIQIFPNCFYYKRGLFELNKICKYAANKGFTALIVINEKAKVPNALYIINLPDGPTAHFKLSNFKLSSEIKGHGRVQTSFEPELILNNFNTRLGHRIGRLFAALLPQTPNFKGRRVCTFHNQRDFIFFRQHRYIFTEEQNRARLQELGPRFTLKLKSLQSGTFDINGEYEWIHKPDMDTSRRRFFL